MNDATFTTGRRADGRGFSELRATEMEVGIISCASGSAAVRFGSTSVMCSVFGPHQTDGKDYLSHGQLECSVEYAKFSHRTRMKAGPGPDLEEEDLPSSLSAALSSSIRLDLYPKSQISIRISILQDDGCAWSAAVCCASLALAHASILLYDMVASCTCNFVGSTIAVDCTTNEQLKGDGYLRIAVMPSLDQLTLLQHTGCCSSSAHTESLKLAMQGCAQLKVVMEKSLLAGSEKLPDNDISLKVPIVS